MNAGLSVEHDEFMLRWH